MRRIWPLHHACLVACLFLKDVRSVQVLLFAFILLEIASVSLEDEKIYVSHTKIDSKLRKDKFVCDWCKFCIFPLTEMDLKPCSFRHDIKNIG